MKRILSLMSLIGALAMMVTMLSCSDNDNDNNEYDQLPDTIAAFVSKYFPNPDIESYDHPSGIYHVKIKDGPGLTFDEDMQWEVINGYGMPLPQMLMFDQLPVALYAFLQETDNTKNVYSVERNSRTYTLELLTSSVIFDIATEQIKQTSTAQ